MSAANQAAAPIVIDIVSDVVCPWCYVGKRRLEAALRERPDDDVVVRWHPFQLDPGIPPGGLDRRTYLAKKFGGQAPVDAMHERLTEAGGRRGSISTSSASPARSTRSNSHRVIHWAGEAGVQDAVKEALLEAYFVEGSDIGDRAVLAAIAGKAGLDPATVAARLETEDDVATVQGAIEAAARIGVSGVPFFIFAQAFAVSGAQSAEVLATAIDRARAHGASPDVTQHA